MWRELLCSLSEINSKNIAKLNLNITQYETHSEIFSSI